MTSLIYIHDSTIIKLGICDCLFELKVVFYLTPLQELKVMIEENRRYNIM